MLDRVTRTISRHGMLPPGARVVAAVSGGPDSVCLLHILRDTAANLTGIAHFNHKLRGSESDEDEQFVAALARGFGIPFYRSEARPEPGNLEQSARRARREFFLTLIRDGACDRVALGHTLDDQAETVLFRMLRGSGLAGLAGIHPVTADGFIRPLIEIRRSEVREYLQSHKIAWREDSSNLDPRFARNRLRNHLLPQLRRDWNPRIDEALAQLADLAFEEERWWNCGNSPVAEASRSMLRSTDALEFDLEKLKTAPRALARRLIRSAIRQVKGDLRKIEFHHVEQILEMRPGRLRIPGLFVARSFGWVRLALHEPAALDALEVTFPGIYEPAALRVEIAETPDPGCANLKVDLATPIVLRGWRPGDHYRPVGKSRDQKLQEMFQFTRIPLWRRRSWPILEREGKILWAREFGAAAEFDAGRRSGPVLQIWDLSHES